MRERNKRDSGITYWLRDKVKKPFIVPSTNEPLFKSPTFSNPKFVLRKSLCNGIFCTLKEESNIFFSSSTMFFSKNVQIRFC